MPKTPNTPAEKPPAGAGSPASQPMATGADEGEAVSPESQQNYEKFVLAGMKILYSEQTHQGIVNMLKQDEPADAMANVVTTIVTQLDQKSGGRIPEEVILPGAAELLELVAELGQKTGTFQADERTLGLAMQKTVMNLAEQYGVEPADVQALLQFLPKDQVQQMVQQQQGFAQPAAPAAQPSQPMGA